MRSHSPRPMHEPEARSTIGQSDFCPWGNGVNYGICCRATFGWFTVKQERDLWIYLM